MAVGCGWVRTAQGPQEIRLTDHVRDRFAWFAERVATIHSNVELVLRGKPEAVRLALVCLLAGASLRIHFSD